MLLFPSKGKLVLKLLILWDLNEHNELQIIPNYKTRQPNRIITYKHRASVFRLQYALDTFQECTSASVNYARHALQNNNMPPATAGTGRPHLATPEPNNKEIQFQHQVGRPASPEQINRPHYNKWRWQVFCLGKADDPTRRKAGKELNNIHFIKTLARAVHFIKMKRHNRREPQARATTTQ